MKDRYGVEVERDDICVICKYNKVFKVKIYKLTDWTVQYLLYDAEHDTYVKRIPIDYSMKNDGSNNYLIKIC